jgi:hypothetical protein
MTGKSPAQPSYGTGCFYAMFCGFSGALLGVMADASEARRMHEEGRMVDFIPVMPFVGLILGVFLGTPAALHLVAQLRKLIAKRRAGRQAPGATPIRPSDSN